MAGFRNDLSGRVFGKLTVLRRGEKGAHNWYWVCRCECGTEVSRTSSQLLDRRNKVKSCGCATLEAIRGATRTHGLSGTRISRQYKGMRQRCLNPNNPSYPDYGGRGITICERWMGPGGLVAFSEDMGECPAEFTIEREEVDGNYSCGKCPECVAKGWPSNCKWVSRADQNRNKRNSFIIEFRGVKKTLTEWCHEMGAGAGVVWDRMVNKEMTFEEAISKPTRAHQRSVTAFGETLTVNRWRERMGVPNHVIIERIDKLKWTPEDAVSIPYGALGRGQYKAAKYLFRGEMLLLSEVADRMGVSPSYFHVMSKRRGVPIQDLISGAT